jgi:hypothetical protein
VKESEKTVIEALIHTIWVNKWEDIEVVVIQESLGNVVARFVTLHKLLRNVFNSTRCLQLLLSPPIDGETYGAVIHSRA